MQLPNSVMRDLHDRLIEFSEPMHGRVKIELELHYRDGQLMEWEVEARPREKFKRVA